jgi:hypothetical protein
MPEELELESVEGGEKTEAMKGTFRPSAYIPISPADLETDTRADTPEREIERAFKTIEEYTALGYRFTGRQKDIAVKTFLHYLSPTEVNWIMEISRQIVKRPLWQCFLGWFRWCHENNIASAPLIDVQWETNSLKEDPVFINCALPSCGEAFMPKRIGEIYHSPECGAKADKAKIDEIIAKRKGPPKVS